MSSANWKSKQTATTPTTNPAAPTNFRRKRRHSEPHLSATKPYKNFVTHWKLDTKKPTPASTPPITSSSASPSPSPTTSSPRDFNHNGNNNPNRSPQSDPRKAIFNTYKKDGNLSPSPSPAVRPAPSPAAPNARWGRRGSLPFIYDSNGNGNGDTSRSVIIEERLETIPEISFPPAHHEYQFPPITLNFPSPVQDDILFRSRADLAPFLNHRSKESQEVIDKTLPSLQSLLQTVRDVSLSDSEDQYGEPDSSANAYDDAIQPPRSYTVRRRMSIDSLLE